jgi:hypothetical protein
MLSTDFFEMARALPHDAQTMTDPRIASELKTLAEDYERRAAKQGGLRLERAQASFPPCPSAL